MDVRFLIFLFGICTTHAFHKLIPEGKSAIYRYEATISTSTPLPKPTMTSFNLHGSLHLQKHNESILVKLTTLTYQLYNGPNDADYKSETLAIPEELHDFSKVFKIDYTPSGVVRGITVGAEEKQYVVNYKKALSAILQLDLKSLAENDKGKNFAFEAKEETLYGKGRVFYNVEVDEGIYYVDVMQQPRNRDAQAHFLSNVEYEIPRGDVLHRDNQRWVKLVKNGGEVVADGLKQNGGIYYNSYNGEGEVYTLYVNQSLVLESLENIREAMVVEGEQARFEGLLYREAELKEVDSIFPDFTNGRRIFDKDQIVEKAFVLVKNIFKAITQMKLERKEPYFRECQFTHSLVRLLLFFDEKMFAALELKLMQEENPDDHLSIFDGLLGEIGTHSSYRHVLKLKDYRKTGGVNLFQNMFVNVKYPNKKLVEAMGEEILNWDPEKIAHEVYNAAILSFATLLHKAVSRHETYKRTNLDLFKEFPNHKYYEKFVLALLEKLKKAERYDSQILYLQALYNTKFPSIIKQLFPAVKGNWWKDTHLRMMAALAISPAVSKNKDLTFEIYWPFMTDPKMPTSFRIMAYYTIMKTQPSLQRLINIYWVMESTKNEELYNFHYEYITQLKQSENSGNAKFKTHLKQILRYTRKPYFKGLTGYYNLDYFSKDYLFGEQIELLSIHCKEENALIISGSCASNVNGLIAKPSWFFLRIAGLQPSLLKQLKLDTTGTNFLLTWEKFKDALFKSKFKFTLIVASNDQAVSTKSYDGTLQEMLHLISPAGFTGFITGYELSNTIYLPTDMGFPAIFYDHIPHVRHNNIKITNKMHGDEILISFDVRRKSLRSAMNGLEFYNPFFDIHQGVVKVITREHHADVQFNVSLDVAQGIFKLSWKESSSGDSILSERNCASKMVFVIDDNKNGDLQKSCAQCVNYQPVSLGKDYKRPENLSPIYFYAEEQLPKDLNPGARLFFNSDGVKNLKDFIKSTLYTITFKQLQPKDVNYCSYKSYQIIDNIPINKMDLMIKLNSEYKKDSNFFNPAVQHKLKVVYTAENDNETFIKFMLDATIAMDDGHANNEYKFDVNSTIAGKEIIYSIEGDLIYTNDVYKSKTYLLIPSVSTKEDPIFVMEVMGEKSNDQTNNVFEYSTCFEQVNSPIANGKSMECLFEYDTLRNYTIKITERIPDFIPAYINGISTIIGKETSIPEIEGVQDNELLFLIEMPVKSTSEYKCHAHGKYYNRAFKVPDNLKTFPRKIVYGSAFELMRRFGLMNSCTIDQKQMRVLNVAGHEPENRVSNDWVLYLGSSKTDAKFEIRIKSTKDNNMDLKIIYESNTFIINPQDKKYTFAVDGIQMEAQKTFFTNNWLHYAWVKNTPIVSIYVRNIGAHITYNGYQANIEYPEIEGVEWTGLCLEDPHFDHIGSTDPRQSVAVRLG